MPHSIRRSRQALLDQQDIWLDIAEDSLRAADRVIERINGAILQLAEQPLSGRARDELHPGLRYLPIDNYLIFYNHTGDTVIIRRVMYGGRDITEALFDT